LLKNGKILPEQKTLAPSHLLVKAWEEPRLGFEKNKKIKNKIFNLFFGIKNLENSPEISKFSQICI